MIIPAALLMMSAAAPSWACDGPFIPPAGYEQETAFSKESEGAAADAARTKLAQRICQKTPCLDLAARVAVWQAGQGTPGFCAMAVVERGLVDEWRSSLSARGFHQRLTEALGPLIAAPAKGKVRVALGEVKGTADGDRAVSAWLRAQIGQALGTMPALDLVDATAPRIDVSVAVSVAERQEAQRAILDVSIELKGKDGALKVTTVSAPRAAVPWTPPSDAAPTGKALELKVEASCQRQAGDAADAPTARGFDRKRPNAGAGFVDVVCGDAPLSEGDHYRVRLGVSEPSFGYVIAYNSLGQFQVLFPFPDEDNALRPSTPLLFPPEDWLTLDAHGGITEHVVVIASRERLPQLEALRGVDIDPKGQPAADERPAAARSFLGAVTSRGFSRQRAKATADGGVSVLEQVQRGPGLAAVELTIAHR